MHPNLLAFSLTLGLHACALLLLKSTDWDARTAALPAPKPLVILVLPPEPKPPLTAEPPDRQPSRLHAQTRHEAPKPTSLPAPSSALIERPRASMAAPPPPSAEDWAFAARYTRKNSKGYRHSWGQQVRSMMGTVVEGPNQGLVRFRVEIAPDGRLQRLQTLWSTSEVAERLARQAIESLPPLPPPPTGQPLVFEKTIDFSPFASNAPPLYRDDCQPEPVAFRNPFAWDGRSAPARLASTPSAPPDPRDMEECLRQLPRDSVEAESAHDQRLLEQWGSQRLGR